MKKIYKYYVPVGISKLRIPEFAEFLHFGFQGNGLYVWALIDEEGLVEYEVNVVGTGWDIIDDADIVQYIGTTQTPDGYVWHAFLTNYRKVICDDNDEDILNRHV